MAQRPVPSEKRFDRIKRRPIERRRCARNRDRRPDAGRCDVEELPQTAYERGNPLVECARRGDRGQVFRVIGEDLLPSTEIELRRRWPAPRLRIEILDAIEREALGFNVGDERPRVWFLSHGTERNLEVCRRERRIAHHAGPERRDVLVRVVLGGCGLVVCVCLHQGKADS